MRNNDFEEMSERYDTLEGDEEFENSGFARSQVAS